MPQTPDEGFAISPQWLVAGVALVAFGLLASYDLRLGAAAGALIGGAGLAWAYFALRFGSLSGAPSARLALVSRVRQQMDNRRAAAGRSGTQQGTDLTEGS
jgi:hypothetical protein